ncbi:MAG: cupin-like domain-containing protein [Erythrobacter sp.]|nr:MAG: cupin-like domain-containing protein [Erythrobacter sp.]
MTQLPSPPPIAKRENVTSEQFHGEVRKGGKPLVFRGLVADWPLVAAGKRGDGELVTYLKSCAATRPVEALTAPAEEGGRFFYNARLTGFNFERCEVTLGAFLDELLGVSGQSDPPAMAVQSEIIPEVLPRLAQENRLDWLPQVAPRMWIGNRIRVAPHYDLMENVACCVAGRRRFTLFPPEEVANLYPGPFELTPAGTPVSMVDMTAPDLATYPRFSEAWAQAQVAELAPGDALYIPYGWWHGVQSLEPVSALVNYWWSDADPALAGAYDGLLHAIAAFRHLPPEQREVWQHMVDHYVFEKNGPPAEHLPPHARGLLGDGSPALFARLRQMLRQVVR